MGIYDDAIQFEAWFEEVWSKGSDCGGEGADTAPITDTWTPLEASKLSREQQMRALSSLLFLKEKRMGDVKG
jgi:hypothetical protein